MFWFLVNTPGNLGSGTKRTAISNARVPAAATGLPIFTPGFYRLKSNRIAYVDRITDEYRSREWFGLWPAKPEPRQRAAIEGDADLLSLNVIERIEAPGR
jgi:hypothetical protein